MADQLDGFTSQNIFKHFQGKRNSVILEDDGSTVGSILPKHLDN